MECAHLQFSFSHIKIASWITRQGHTRPSACEDELIRLCKDKTLSYTEKVTPRAQKEANWRTHLHPGAERSPAVPVLQQNQAMKQSVLALK